MERAIPILQIHSYAGATAHYVDWLGFRIDWEFRFEPNLPVYMQISRGGVVLHLSEHAGDGPMRSMCHLEVDDIDGWVAELRQKRPDFLQTVELAPWNARHIALKDPFGNTLGVNQYLPDAPQ